MRRVRVSVSRFAVKKIGTVRQGANQNLQGCGSGMGVSPMIAAPSAVAAQSTAKPSPGKSSFLHPYFCSPPSNQVFHFSFSRRAKNS
jgi:hypothetical protein